MATFARTRLAVVLVVLLVPAMLLAGACGGPAEEAVGGDMEPELSNLLPKLG